MPMHTNKQGVSAGATCNPTPIGKLKLFVKSQTGETTEFIVKKTMKMEKLFTRYADKYNMDWRELRFLFDGERIQHDETPESATLEDGDQLQALLVQDGGFAFPLHRVGVEEDGMDGGGSGGKTMKKGSGPKGPTETLESNLGKCCNDMNLAAVQLVSELLLFQYHSLWLTTQLFHTPLYHYPRIIFSQYQHVQA